MIECKLVSSKRQTAFGPLCALGHYLTKEGVLEPLCGVQIAQKTVVHSPQEKLLDALIGILCGRRRPSTRSIAGCGPTCPCKELSEGVGWPISPRSPRP
jgi:hypothetical protein